MNPQPSCNGIFLFYDTNESNRVSRARLWRSGTGKLAPLCIPARESPPASLVRGVMLSYRCVKCDLTHTGVIAVGMLHTLGTWGKTSQVFGEKHNMPHCLHQRLGTQFGSAVDLPLCLARYLPRTMIRHKVTKTTTATTPPIKAWSVPCCPKAFGSEERRREREREAVRFAARRWAGARAEEQQKAAGERKQSEEEGLFVGRCCSNEPLSFRPSSAAQLSEMWGERGRGGERQTDGWIGRDGHTVALQNGESGE